MASTCPGGTQFTCICHASIGTDLACVPCEMQLAVRYKQKKETRGENKNKKASAAEQQRYGDATLMASATGASKKRGVTTGASERERALKRMAIASPPAPAGADPSIQYDDDVANSFLSPEADNVSITSGDRKPRPTNASKVALFNSFLADSLRAGNAEQIEVCGSLCFSPLRVHVNP